jgi:hypothetical protein
MALIRVDPRLAIMNLLERITPLKFVAWFTLTLGALYVFSFPYLLYLPTTPDFSNDPDAVEAVKGMRIGAIACAVLAVPTVLAGWKLLKHKTWAYWLAVAHLAMCVFGLAAGTIDEWREEKEPLLFFLIFLTVFVLAVLPVSRRELKQAV